MAKPVRQRIIEAVRDELAAIGVAVVLYETPTPAQIAELGELGADGVVIARDGLPGELPALSIEDRGDTVLGQDGFATRKRLELEILGDVDASGATDAAAELSRRYQQLAAQVETRLLANQQWGGLAALTVIGDLEVEIIEGADPRTATTAQTVRIQYAIRTGDPFTSAS